MLAAVALAPVKTMHALKLPVVAKTMFPAFKLETVNVATTGEPAAVEIAVIIPDP